MRFTALAAKAAGLCWALHSRIKVPHMSDAFRTIRVPASSANLGPGFDTLGLALELYLQCRFRHAEELTIRVSGRDSAQIPTGEDNLIWQIARQVFFQYGAGRHDSGVPGASGAIAEPIAIELIIENDIPLGKGLGSSAAAVMAGVIIGADLAGLEWDRARVLDEAARIEGHPDNAAACALGGFVASAMVVGAPATNPNDSPMRQLGAISALSSAGGCANACAVRLEFPAAFGVAVIVPGFQVPTSDARRVLPDSYSREDAIFNLQRTALLVAALATGAAGAFPAALEDRLHQPHRFALVPGLREVTRLRARGLIGCALSGAGPSILVFYERGHEEVCELARQVFSAMSPASMENPEILWTKVAARGYEVS
jgi:homoserine kinase